MTSPFHSIRWRLQAWHGLILLVAILALCATVHRLAVLHEYRRIDRELADAEHALVRGLMRASQPADQPDGPGGPRVLLLRLREGGVPIPEELAARFAGTEGGYVYFIIKDSDGRVLMRSENAPDGRTLLPVGPGEFNEDLRTIDRFRESLRTSREGIATLVGRDISPEREQMARFTGSLVASGLGVWALGLLGGWWLAGRAIRPIATISRTATRIADGNLRERIDTAGTDNELDQLGRVLNRTFDRLNESFERQRRFTADAAHELRTPITILVAETQRVLKRERTAAEYREALQTCHDTAGRMRRLAEALLLLARLENADAAPPRQTCDLAVVVAAAMRELEPLAKERRVALYPDLRSAPCQGDPDALGILMGNLVANAIQHHREAGGGVWITSRDENGRAVCTVRDDGPGIPDAALPHIFERFHRADEARTGGSAHTGLGLAIARTIVLNHGGTITAENRSEGGAGFTVSLPVGEP